MNDKWDVRFLRLAKEVSTWSKDPSTQVGCVIINPETLEVVSLGYNGFPRRMQDKPEWLNNREEKISRIVHAEMNALINDKSVIGCTAYIYPILSCSRCAVHLIQSGINRVVTFKPSPEIIERWGVDLDKSRQYYLESDVECVEFENVPEN